MRAQRNLVLIGLLSTVVAACDDYQAARPMATAPSPVSPPTRTGQVSLRSIRPASGATLLMRDCTWEPETSGGNTQICSTEPRLTVDLEFDGDINATLTAYYYRGSQICAVSWGRFQGTSGSAEMNSISLTDVHRPDEVLTTTANRCTLPIVTHQVVVKVVERAEIRLTNPLQLTSEPFAHTYTFDVPQSLRALP